MKSDVLKIDTKINYVAKGLNLYMIYVVAQPCFYVFVKLFYLMV